MYVYEFLPSAIFEHTLRKDSSSFEDFLRDGKLSLLLNLNTHTKWLFTSCIQRDVLLYIIKMGILLKKDLSLVLTIGSGFTFAFLVFTADLHFRFLLLSLIRNLLFFSAFFDCSCNFSATDSARRFF